MPTCTLQDIFQDVRSYLNDTGYMGSIPTGEVFVNAVLPTFFSEPYRTMFSTMAGASKRVQRVETVVLPALTSVLIPSTYGIMDFSEPEMIEERPALSGKTITSTAATTPIRITITAHGLGGAGSVVQGSVCNVLNTMAPWGAWFATVVDANTLSLNGSASDGVAGSGGFFFPNSSQQFQEVLPIDLAPEGLDGPPQQVLGSYLWINEQILFRGSTQATQLRLTYYVSGTAPTNPNYTINLDNARDFLAVATAANAAASKGWDSMASSLRLRAYGDQSVDEVGGLLLAFLNVQVLASQRGPIRRQAPFRSKRFRVGGMYLLG